MADSEQDKTEAPTPKRRQDARDEGRIPRSPELTMAMLLLASAAMINLVGPAIGNGMIAVFGLGLRALASAPLDLVGSVSLLRALGWRAGSAIAAWCCGLAVIGLVIGGAQARGVLSLKALEPKWERLNPMTNAKRMLGVEGLVGLVRSLAKFGIVSLAVYKAMSAAWPDIMALAQEGPGGLLQVMQRYAVKLLMTTGLCYLALAAADYLWQWWQHEKSLRMSKDEVKQEMKQSEGDPLVKQRMRSMARSLARRQMMRDVPKADVVITNPTHIAVAIRYDPDLAPAPFVVAIGQRKVAERIKQIAREKGIPTIENKPLARALLASCKVGTTIPGELYVAIAEILAFIYRRRALRGAPLREVYA